jgi:hypothetical protein
LSATRTVGVLSPTDEEIEPYVAAVRHGQGRPEVVSADAQLPESVGGLLVIGERQFSGDVPAALRDALARELPVLGVNRGMHALNVALGGKPPVEAPDADGAPVKRPVFLSPGGKVSSTITGSGWVSVMFRNSWGIRPSELGPGLLATCYREDQFVAAFEVPGRHWTIGVQWDAHRVDELPGGFDNLLLALCERAVGE